MQQIPFNREMIEFDQLKNHINKLFSKLGLNQYNLESKLLHVEFIINETDPDLLPHDLLLSYRELKQRVSLMHEEQTHPLAFKSDTLTRLYTIESELVKSRIDQFAQIRQRLEQLEPLVASTYEVRLDTEIEQFKRFFTNEIESNTRRLLIDPIEQIINLPNLFLSNWFNELKHSIDLVYAKQDQAERSDQLRALWLNTIKLVEKYENLCYLKSPSIAQYKEVIKQKLTIPEYKRVLFEAKRLVFLNKTIFFLPYRRQFALFTRLNFSSSLARTLCGILLVFNKQFLQDPSDALAKVINDNAFAFKLLNVLSDRNEFPRLEHAIEIEPVHDKQKITLSKYIDLTNLTDLNLNSCSLDTLDSHVLDALYNLEWLTLCDNNIKSLPLGVFKSLKKLIALKLDQNELAELRPNQLVGLTSLKLLTLKQNKLVRIDSNAFLYLKNLQVLDLSHNRLGFLSESVFAELTELRELDLSSNQLKYVSCVFEKMNWLSRLDLSSNVLRSIEVDLLVGQTNLVELNLANNLLEFIEIGTLDQLVNLTHLYLNGNRKLRVEAELVYCLTRLKVLQADYAVNLALSSVYFDRLLKLNILKEFLI